MAKLIQVEAFAGADFLNHVKLLVDQPIPEPKAGEVLVAPFLRPVNPTDVLFTQGAYGTTFPLPRTPGSEGVAKVLKNGDGCSKFSAGQRVVAVQYPQFSSGGSWTTHICIPEKDLVAVPDSVCDETAAQFFINPVTVYGMFKELSVPKGDYILQAAAGSTLGRQAISLAKHYGIKTINVVRRSDAVAELKALGADEVIATDCEDVVERVMAITGGKGAYGALDPVGGPLTAKLIASLRKGGTYIAYGLLDPSSPSQFNAMDLLGGGKLLRGFIIYEWIERPDKEAILADVMKLLVDEVIVPFSGEKFSMENFKEAMIKSQAVGRGPKIFLDSRI